MTLEQELALSYYKKVAKVNEAHNVWLVQDVRTNEFYIQKILTVYHTEVYRQLKDNPIRNTPAIQELIEADGKLYVIEEYIAGPTLEEALRRSGPMGEKPVRDLAVRLCGILGSFHRLEPPIINRDIKPSNLKLTRDGELKLLDLNAARSYQAAGQKDTELLGTAGYAAPEQYGFGQSDVRTDVYATGRLMQVLLTGSLEQALPTASKLTPIIKKCTALDPRDRYQTIEELRYALAREAPGFESGMEPPKPSQPGPVRRSIKALLWLLSAVGCSVLLYAAMTISHPTLTGAVLSAYRAIVTVGVACILLLTGNFFQLQSRLLGRCDRQWIRILKVLGADCLIFFLMVVICSSL